MTVTSHGASELLKMDEASARDGGRAGRLHESGRPGVTGLVILRKFSFHQQHPFWHGLVKTQSGAGRPL
jgi:hypothetical protein